MDRKTWCEALRGEKYEKGRNYLRSPPDEIKEGYSVRYCCLGVAVSLAGGEKVLQKMGRNSLETNEFPRGYKKLDKELGLTQVRRALLAEMNDDGRFTFEDIANFIEAPDFNTRSSRYQSASTFLNTLEEELDTLAEQKRRR